MPVRMLLVYPNPYCVIDHEGRPAGAVPVDPSHDPDRHWVGARLVAEPLEKNADGVMRHDNTFEFSSDPVPLPLTHYYTKELHQGSLLPADAFTAKVAGRGFASLPTMLEVERAKAAQRFHDAYPDEPLPDWAAGVSLRRHDTPIPAGTVPALQDSGGAS